jgi:hypothetical protein
VLTGDNSLPILVIVNCGPETISRAASLAAFCAEVQSIGRDVGAMLRRSNENSNTLKASVFWLALALLGLLPAACGRTSSNAEAVNAIASATASSVRHTVQLRWNPSSSPDVRTYRVYRGSKSGGPYSLVGITPGDEHTFVDDKVQSGSTCFYVVRAVNRNLVESTASNEVGANIPSR